MPFSYTLLICWLFCPQFFQGTYSLNSSCVTCSRCHQGQVVVSECSILRDTVCRTAPIHITSPHTQNVNVPTLLPTNLTPEPSLGTTGSRSEIEKGNIILHITTHQLAINWFQTGVVTCRFLWFHLFCSSRALIECWRWAKKQSTLISEPPSFHEIIHVYVVKSKLQV